MFAPLLSSYLTKLSDFLYRSQGLILVKKGDFFLLFWDAYTTSFTRKNILKAFKASGVKPCDEDAVLKRFKNITLQQFEDAEIAQLGDGTTWNDLCNLLRVTVTNTLKVKAQASGTAIHSL